MKFIKVETYPPDYCCNNIEDTVAMLVNLTHIALIDTLPHLCIGGNYYRIYLKDNYEIYISEESYQTLVKELNIC